MQVEEKHNHPCMEQFTHLTKRVLKLTKEMSTNKRNEKLRKFNEHSEKIDEQLKARGKTKSTTDLGYEGNNKTKKFESSRAKNLGYKNQGRTSPKGMKPKKPTYYCFGKVGRTSNVYWHKQVNPSIRCTFNGYRHNCH